MLIPVHHCANALAASMSDVRSALSGWVQCWVLYWPCYLLVVVGAISNPLADAPFCCTLGSRWERVAHPICYHVLCCRLNLLGRGSSSAGAQGPAVGAILLLNLKAPTGVFSALLTPSFWHTAGVASGSSRNGTSGSTSTSIAPADSVRWVHFLARCWRPLHGWHPDGGLR